MHRILFVRSPQLDSIWPFVPERFAQEVSSFATLETIELEREQPLSAATDLTEFNAIALFGGHLSETCLAQANALQVIGGVMDNAARGLPVDALFAREIPIIDATRGWAASVAEVTLALALCGLRRITDWHHRMTMGESLWDFEYQQWCDAPGFVSGTLGTKTVGVMGLGQIGGRVAAWCAALGSRVLAYDPFAPAARFTAAQAQSCDLDTLVEAVDVLFVMIPPTPSAKGILSAKRIARLKRGALVVVTTRAHAVDMVSLRERILADEIAGAFDVYDIEPLPVDDPLRGRANVVHTPHIAGRTQDANLAVADILATEFQRVLKGEAPQMALTREAIAVRTSTQMTTV